MPTLHGAQVTIVGLGLMGGSLAWALKASPAGCEVVGVARREVSAARAMERGLVDRATTDLSEAVVSADVVVLATPVRTIIELLPRVGHLAKPGCTITDLGSTKAAIVQAMSILPPHLDVVGGHPMCGKEASGLDAAEPDLYQNRVFVLTPLARTGAGALALVQEIVEAVGARSLVLEAELHDWLVAAISHLPYLLACGLVATAEQWAGDEPKLWQLAAGGFRDTSRLAACNVQMMVDILVTNRAAVLGMLDACQAQLHVLRALIQGADEDHLQRELDGIAQRRRSLVA